MTKQEIFNKVKKHLLKQKVRAENKKGQCKYIMKDGRRCAIGCLLDKKAAESFYGGVGDLIRLQYPEFIAILPSDSQDKLERMEFLVELQSIHDHYTPKFWMGQLHTFAQRYDLTYGN